MKKKVIALITIITVIICGCSCNNGVGNAFGSNGNNRNSANDTNVYIENYYGADYQIYWWTVNPLASGIMKEMVGYKSENNYYFKTDNSLYKVSNNECELLLENDVFIWSIIKATDNFVVFTDLIENEADSEKELRLNVYYLDTGLKNVIEKYSSGINCYSYVDIEDIIVKNEGSDHLYFVTNIADSPSIFESETIQEMPEEYYIKKVAGCNDEENYAICATDKNGNVLNLNLTRWHQNSSRYIDMNVWYTSHQRRNLAYKTIVIDDSVILQHVKYDERGSSNPLIADESHCDTYYWKNDVLEKYDFASEKSNDFYSDSINRILGYNYEENIVYLYSFSKNEIEAKDLDDNSVTTLSSLEKAQTIKFTWCDKTLFWIYENDEVESYGGYLDL